jgi:hypothetical protein
LSNPGWEEGLTAWTTGSVFSVTSAEKRSGSNSLRVSGTGSWQNALQIINVNTNTDYVFSVYIKGTGDIQLKVSDMNWATVGATRFTPTSSWAKYEIQFNSGANTSVRMVFQDASTGISYLDDAWMSVAGAGTVAVTGVSVSPSSASVDIGETITLAATVSPANATNKNVTWSSSNTSVATVNSSGVVSALAAGTATITVTTQDGGKTASSAITVNSQVLNALMVVGNATLNPSDQIAKNRLEAMGYQVTVKAAASTATADANGMDVIFVSATVNSSEVNTKFRNVNVGVVSAESFIYDDMQMTGLTSGSHYGVTNSQTQVNVVNTTHPLGTGLTSGVNTILTTGDNMGWGVPSASAIIIAYMTGSTTQAAFFAYEAGSSMVGLTAPGRRVGIVFEDNGLARSNSQGLLMFDNAICWAAGMCGLKSALVKQPEVEIKTLVYPNPSKGAFNIRLSEDKNSEVVIYNVAGGIVFANSYSEREIYIQPDLKTGMYILVINSNGKSEHHKLIIQ